MHKACGGLRCSHDHEKCESHDDHCDEQLGIHRSYLTPATRSRIRATPTGADTGTIGVVSPIRLVPCAGGLVYDDVGRLLLIRRATPPARGQWSVPGGRCEPGESAERACEREVAEETGLIVRVQRLAGRVQRPGPMEQVFAIDDFVCQLVGGQLDAATDAEEARWVTGAQYQELDAAGLLVPRLTEALTSWRALPR